ncbi:hypothetical protein GCM10011297_18190 [Bacterioplanes sanyensis]|nr:hypothetical protein GCM10011297_18190 [Bacterioplanes sanyensis]
MEQVFIPGFVPNCPIMDSAWSIADWVRSDSVVSDPTSIVCPELSRSVSVALAEHYFQFDSTGDSYELNQ